LPLIAATTGFPKRAIACAKIEAAATGWAGALIVPAETEHIAVPGQDTPADARIATGLIESGRDFLSHALGDAIAVLGPMHSNDLHAASPFDRN
jgi:hypothetical protein